MTSTKPPSCSSSCDDDATDSPVDGVRRRLLGGAAAAGVLGALPFDAFAGCHKRAGPRNVRFTHGVASGDPLSDRVILWTRVRAQDTDDCRDVPVQWEIALDAGFSRIMKAGEATARRSDDFCVKVDAVNLEPGTRYWYRFKVDANTSDIGQTKTLPVGAVEQVRLAVFSCANYAAGYFNVYAEAVKRINADPGRYDALLHLGDYIYESSADGYGSDHAKALGRVVEPLHETLTIHDYRRRYAQCREDTDLQRLHQLAPMIAIWDDHEFANNAWRDGAENHQETEGTFKRRRAVAARAWREWLPVRDTVSETEEAKRLVIHRGFDFGNLLSLDMLDTRLRSRQKQLTLKDFMSPTGFDKDAFRNALNHQDRELLGGEQREWLSKRMMKSDTTWRVLGQQVLMARMDVPLPIMMRYMDPKSGLSPQAYENLAGKASRTPDQLTPQERQQLALPRVPYNLDAWDGYPDSRERLLDEVVRHGQNLVVLTGDTHNAWASDLTDRKGTRHLGVEFATPSVTSPGLEVTLVKLEPDPKQVARFFRTLVPSLKFAETSRRGFLEITATHQECRGDWILVSTVLTREYTAEVARSLRVLPKEGNRRLIEI